MGKLLFIAVHRHQHDNKHIFVIIRAVWNKLEDARRERGREEIIVEYDLLNGRLDVLQDDYFEGDMLVTSKV